jgi:hypothetical protein
LQAVETMPPSMAATALTRYSTSRDGRASAALTASAPLVSASAGEVTIRRRRRPIASPSAPPASAPKTSGSSWARLTAPTCSEDRVSAYTWNGMATLAS